MNSNKISLRIATAAEPYVRNDTPREERLKAAKGEVPLVPLDRVALLFFLYHDQDPEVKSTALASLRGLSESMLLEVLEQDELHGRIIDLIARLHFSRQAVVEMIARHPYTDDGTIDFLKGKGVVQEQADDSGAEMLVGGGEQQPIEEAQEVVPEEEEEFKSKYQMVQSMSIGEKIKTALTGDKEFRSLLIKDSNKLVSGAVVKNPRITDPEILAIAKSAIQNDEIMRVICANKEWVKNYSIRKAIVENSKTPLPIALRFLGFITDKDLEKLAKSKNVSTVIATQARRQLSKSKNK